MVTLKDIAEQVGVSKAVVSCVLNDRLETVRVSEAKKRLIIETARKLDYVPNLRAKSVAEGKSFAIGVIVSGYNLSEMTAMGRMYCFDILCGVEEECKSSNYHCLYSSRGFRGPGGFEHPMMMRDGSLDGAVLIGETTVEEAERLASKGIPCVHIGTNINPDCGIDCVYEDLDALFERLCVHLRRLGHRRVQLMFPSGPGPALHGRRFMELAGVIEGLEPEVYYFPGMQVKREDAVAHAKKMLARCNPPTAYLGAEAHWLGLAEGMAQEGKTCPGDYSLVGLGYSSLQHGRIQPGDVKLTRTLSPLLEIGRQAARFLLAKIGVLEIDPQECLRAVPVEIIYGDSCGVCLETEDS